jgi:hypothetical protein
MEAGPLKESSAEAEGWSASLTDEKRAASEAAPYPAGMNLVAILFAVPGPTLWLMTAFL